MQLPADGKPADMMYSEAVLDALAEHQVPMKTSRANTSCIHTCHRETTKPWHEAKRLPAAQSHKAENEIRETISYTEVIGDGSD